MATRDGVDFNYCDLETCAGSFESRGEARDASADDDKAGPFGGGE